MEWTQFKRLGSGFARFDLVCFGFSLGGEGEREEGERGSFFCGFMRFITGGSFFGF